MDQGNGYEPSCCTLPAFFLLNDRFQYVQSGFSEHCKLSLFSTIKEYTEYPSFPCLKIVAMTGRESLPLDRSCNMKWRGLI